MISTAVPRPACTGKWDDEETTTEGAAGRGSMLQSFDDSSHVAAHKLPAKKRNKTGREITIIYHRGRDSARASSSVAVAMRRATISHLPPSP